MGREVVEQCRELLDKQDHILAVPMKDVGEFGFSANGTAIDLIAMLTSAIRLVCGNTGLKPRAVVELIALLLEEDKEEEDDEAHTR